MATVHILGMGPGHADYILPITTKIARSSDTLIGSPRLLELFRGLEKKEIALKANYLEIIDYIKREKDHEAISILVSGDPSFYSFTKKIKAEIEDCRIIPAIGSISIAFARAGLQWQEALFTSVHGRDRSCLKEGSQKTEKHLAILTDPKNNPRWTAKNLLAMKNANRPVWIMSNLGLEDEKIKRTDLYSLSLDEEEYPSLTVLIVEALKK